MNESGCAMRMMFWLFGVVSLLNTGVAIREFNDEYPDVRICSSTMKRSNGEHKMPQSYNYLRNHFEGVRNCTHVEGNLVIINIYPTDIEPDLSFLESIREITGMLYMRHNDIRRIILPNLRVIRGQDSTPIDWHNDETHKVSLYINVLDEKASAHAILPNLRVISNNSVYFNSSSSEHFLPNSIRWDELFQNPKEQRLFVGTERPDNHSCHSSCNTNKNIFNKCWSEDPQHCQPKTKCNTTSSCQWCYLIDGLRENCCNEECSGGCYDFRSSKCAVCKNFINNDTCVASCSFVSNNVKESKLRVDRMCAKTCPDNLKEEGDACLFKCSTPKYTLDGKKCLPCFDSLCDLKECHIDDSAHKANKTSFYMTKEILENFTECQHVIGTFHFTDRSFDRKKGKITVPMLYKHLKNVEKITGDLLIDGTNISLGNLTFLENLKEINHQLTESATTALAIIYADVEFLGLRRLRQIFGDFGTYSTPKLCYYDTLPWTERILKLNKKNPIIIPCNKTCDPQCTFGCWGPGSDMCYQCKYVRAGSNCVEKCQDEPGFYFNETTRKNLSSLYDDGSCQRCHRLCAQNCTGPDPDHCLGKCRFYKEDNKCVEKCTNEFYGESGICYRCNENCRQGDLSQQICSGNGTHLGSRGCRFCMRFITIDNKTFTCFKKTKCPNGFYPIQIPLNEIAPYSSAMSVQICLKCPYPCSKCQGTSFINFKCLECAYGFWSDGKCNSTCDSQRIQSTQTISLNSSCEYCHKQCSKGCLVANNASYCLDCVGKRLVVDELLSKFVCVEYCSGLYNFTYLDDQTNKLYCMNETQYSNSNPHSIRSKQRKDFIRKMSLIIISLVICVMVVLFFIWHHFYNTNKTKSIKYLKALYSNIREPDTRIMLTHKDVPNMNRLLLIPATNLIFDIRSKPLGTGAFGAVYQGVWKLCSEPNRKNEGIKSLDVAIKVIQSNRNVDIHAILEEAKVMASVSHKHCLRLIGICLKYEMPCLVTTFVELGSLDKYLRKHRFSLSSYDLLSWAEQIANGMAYLEMRNIIHRDLASRNVLLNSSHLVQITDFGLSHILQGSENNNEIIITSGQVPIRWLALETLTSGIYSHKTDVWAFGVTMWEIFTFGERPYDDMEAKEIVSFLQQNNRLPQPDICSLQLYALMTQCWFDISQDRPSFSELMTSLFEYCHHPTYYLYVTNDPCFEGSKFHKQRCPSQCSYEMQPYFQKKSVYKQNSMDGTITTFIGGDYQDDLLESSLRRQSSNFSWSSKQFKTVEDKDKKTHLLRQKSLLSDNIEENEPFPESGESDELLDSEYLEPIKK